MRVSELSASAGPASKCVGPPPRLFHQARRLSLGDWLDSIPACHGGARARNETSIALGQP